VECVCFHERSGVTNELGCAAEMRELAGKPAIMTPPMGKCGGYIFIQFLRAPCDYESTSLLLIGLARAHLSCRGVH